MARYVKFYRGTPEAFNKLAEKNDDTLYFIASPDSSVGQLYLGSKLISGGSHQEGEEEVVVASLSDLQDVLITANLSDESFLIYDEDVHAWTNKPLEDLEFIGATSQSAGLAGLVPAPKLGEQNLFLRANGEWDTPVINHTIITLENTDKSTHQDLISDEGWSPIDGDIVIIKDLIANGEWQYTAYVYAGGVWSAMDGNYDASNVYFSEDLTTTTAIGNITLTDGQAVIPAAGKNLKEVFETIFVKEANPTIEQPSITLTFSQAKAYEVGTTVYPTFTAVLNAGSYQYGPATGITATGWTATDTNGNIKNLRNGTFPSFVVTDNTSYSISVQADFEDGEIPLTNLGNEYNAGQIVAGSVSKTSGKVTGYRKSFYGTFANKEDLTGAKIRDLSSSTAALTNGSSVSVQIPIGAYRVVFAYPSTLQDLSSVKDKNGLEAEIISGFSKSTLNVEGADGYDAIEYKVYSIDYAKANDTENYYTFKI